MIEAQTFDDELISKILVNTDKSNGFKDFLIDCKSTLTKNVGDPFLYYYSFKIKKKLLNNYDHITIITGKEGRGKSTFANKLAVMTDSGISIDYVCYKPMDLINALKIAKKGDSIWIDEGALFLFSRDAMGGANKLFIKLFTISRQLNLHIIICIPNFFILDTYLREHRVNSLFHITDRGKYKYFSEQVLSLVSVFGRKSKNVMSPDIKLNKGFRYGWFNSYWPDSLGGLTQDLYEERKTANMDEYLDDLQIAFEEMGESVTGKDRKDFSDDEGWVDVKTFGKFSSLHPNTIKRYINDGKLKGRKVGGKYMISRSEMNSV